MLTLRVSFPWGRYYAHPWGQNPARITEAEWPPSPWRLLRAIAAAWFQANPGRNASSELIQTLEVLGRELPEFVLPKVSFSRTVHYQPNFGATPKADVAIAKYKRVRHENHFVSVGGDVLVRWKLSGIDEATRSDIRSLIIGLADGISYFGRAESVCEVSIDNAFVEDALAARVVLHNHQPARQISLECRDVFCPNPADFRATDLWKRRDDNAPEDSAPQHLVQELIDAPQPLPDGAAWYSFRMPEGWPQKWVVCNPRPPRTRQNDAKVVARCLEFSLQCRIPVPAKHVVSIAELFRSAAMSIHGEPSFALSGHGRADDPGAGHLHAFYLPQTNSSGHSLDRLLVWCAHGFTQRELNSLMGVGALRWAGGRFPVRPVLLRVQLDLPPLQSARLWESSTLYVPPRFWYRSKLRNGRVREFDSPENQLRQNLLENGVDASSASIRRCRPADAEWNICKVHLSKRARQFRSEPDRRVGVHLQVQFTEPTSLAFPSFGHSSHFGLGQFRPIDS